MKFFKNPHLNNSLGQVGRQMMLILILISVVFANEFASADKGRDSSRDQSRQREEVGSGGGRMFNASRGLRKGVGGRNGNENSMKPGRLPGVGPIEKDIQREKDENKVERAKNGCPEGSYALTFAPDGLSFSLLFDRFVAQTSPSQVIDVMRCHLIVPVDVPENTRMTITRIDYRGFVKVPVGGIGVLRAAYSFQGKRNGSGPGNSRAYSVNFRQIFEPREWVGDQNYILSSDAFTDRQATSECGGVNNLRISNTLRVQGAGQDAMLTLDSMDGVGELKYFVSYERCQN